jgi:ABC-2 type transport system permease protein
LERAAVTRLIWAEVTRLLSRRFTVIALIALLLGLGGFQLVVNDALSPLTGAQLAAAQRAYEQTHKDWVDSHEKYEQECRDSGGTAEECAFPEPTLAHFSVEPTPFKDVAHTALQLSTALVALVAFMIAASSIGAEYSSGSITNWLTFVPRRGPVFWSKLLTLVGFAALLGAFGVAVMLAAALVLARLYGSRIESLRELAEMGARSVLAVVGLAMLGFCIGMVTRHTASPIGLLLGYVVVWFLRMGILGEQAWTQRITPWTPEANLAAIVDHGFTYSVPVERVTSDGVEIDYVEHAVSLTHGAIYWSILLVLVVMGSLLIFRRRDVM